MPNLKPALKMLPITMQLFSINMVITARQRFIFFIERVKVEKCRDISIIYFRNEYRTESLYYR